MPEGSSSSDPEISDAGKPRVTGGDKTLRDEEITKELEKSLQSASPAAGFDGDITRISSSRLESMKARIVPDADGDITRVSSSRLDSLKARIVRDPDGSRTHVVEPVTKMEPLHVEPQQVEAVPNGEPEIELSSGSLLLPLPHATDSRMLKRFKLIGALLSVPVMLAGVLSLVGWICDVDVLRTPFGEPGLRSAGAINTLLLAVAALLAGLGNRRWQIVLGKAVAAVVMIGSSANLVEHLFQLHWDNLVLYELIGSPSITYPGPLTPYDAFSFAFAALSIVLCDLTWRAKGLRLAEPPAAIVFVPNLIILCFYLVGQSHLCVYLGCVKFSPMASLVFLFLCLEVLFLRPETGVINILTRRNSVGIFSRRALISVTPVILILFLRQCLAQVIPQDAVNDLNMVTSVVVAGLIAVLAWWSLRRVSSEETAKQLVNAKIKQRDKMLEQKEQEIQILQSSHHSSRHYKLVCLECAKEFDDLEMKYCPEDGSELLKILDNLRAGALFGDRYRIVRELGSGGMSTVYLARHELMNKDVAVKVLQMQYSSDAKMIQRFQREARAASSLSHPNLVAVHDFNVTNEGQAFMVMEFLQGCSLIELVQNQGALPWRQAVPLFLQILDGLNHAHSNGVIHRDLKPGNVMLVPVDGAQGFQAKIVDFGFAKLGEDKGQQLTRTGEVFGSPLYMSPEQCQGQPMDKRSDLYALGCIMYIVLTGDPPFHGNNMMETLSMHMHEAPQAMAPELSVPDWLEKVTLKLLEKEQSARYQSAVDIIVALNVGLSTMAAEESKKPTA